MQPSKSAARAVIYSAYTFVILLYIFSSPPFICAATLICAAMHEACHILCAAAFKRKIKPLSFSVTGLYPDVGRGSAASCVAIYIAGPIFNILMCGICFFLFRSFPSQTVVELFSVNAALGCFNLLPIPFSDGSGIIRICISRLIKKSLGDILCGVVETLFSFMLFVLFSYRFFMLQKGLFSFLCSFVFVVCALGRITRE